MGSTVKLTFIVPPGGAQSVATLGACKLKSVTLRVIPTAAVAGPLATWIVNGYAPGETPEGTLTVTPMSASP